MSDNLSATMVEGKLTLNESELSLDEIRQLRAMGFEIVEQGTEEWHMERLGNATASNFWKIVNWSAGRKLKDGSWATGGEPKPSSYWYSYRNELLAERLSGQFKRFTTKPIEWGKSHEDDAAQEYEKITGNEIRTVGFIKHPELDAGASLDRIVGDDGCVEIKCPNTDTMIDYILADGPPPQYYAQIQGQLWISHRKWCDFVVFDPALGETFIKRVERDAAFIADMEYKVELFLSQVDKLEEKLRDQGYGAN